MKNVLITLPMTLLAVAHVATAQTIVSFDNLTTQLDSTNSIGTGAFTTADAELTISGAASGNNYIYSVTFTGQSYDGDATNDTLSFDVLVQGWTGSLASTNFTGAEANVNASHGTVTSIGTTDGAVSLGGNRFSVDSATMNQGKTVEFSLQNFSLTTSQGAYAASLDSFTGVSYQETGNGFGHTVVVGDVGTSKFDTRFNATTYNIVDLLDEADQLYVTAADYESDAQFTFSGDVDATLPSANPQRWAISNVDFDIQVTAVPEPSTFTLLMAGLGSLLVVRRRCS